MFRAAIPLAALPPGAAHRLPGPPPVTVFHTEDGGVYAIDDTCTHQDASLADGWLEGCLVECPLHSSRFDLRTGDVDGPPARLPVRTHPVRVVDGIVYVGAGEPGDPAGAATEPAPAAP